MSGHEVSGKLLGDRRHPGVPPGDGGGGAVPSAGASTGRHACPFIFTLLLLPREACAAIPSQPAHHRTRTRGSQPASPVTLGSRRVLHWGTNTVMFLFPSFQKYSTAMAIPRQEKNLFRPWLRGATGRFRREWGRRGACHLLPALPTPGLQT